MMCLAYHCLILFDATVGTVKLNKNRFSFLRKAFIKLFMAYERFPEQGAHQCVSPLYKTDIILDASI